MRFYNVILSLIVTFAILTVPCRIGAVDDPPGAGFGGRMGLGLEPDQFVIGPQAVFGNVGKFLRFAPSFDFGFGDNVTTYAFDGDLRLNLFRLPGSDANLYVDAGPTIAHFDFDGGSNDTEVGLDLSGGVALPMGSSNSYNVEASFGFGDVTEIRLLFGFYFGREAARGEEIVDETDVDVDVDVDSDKE